MSDEEMSLEEMLKAWAFQDTFRDIALELIARGAHLGALAMAKNVTVKQIIVGNRTLRNEEMMELVTQATIEVKQQTKKGIEDARGA